MIGETFDIETAGKNYTLIQQDNFVALEINAILQTLIHIADIGDDEEFDNVSLQRGFRGPIIEEVKKMIIKCSHTPKFTKESVLNIEPSSIAVMFLSIYNQHYKVAEDKKKDPTKSSVTQQIQNTE